MSCASPDQSCQLQCCQEALLAVAAERSGVCPADRIDPKMFPVTQTQYRPSSMPPSPVRRPQGHRVGRGVCPLCPPTSVTWRPSNHSPKPGHLLKSTPDPCVWQQDGDRTRALNSRGSGPFSGPLSQTESTPTILRSPWSLRTPS